MREVFRVFCWDDEVILWLASIMEEVQRLRPKWVVTYENPDGLSTKKGSRLFTDYQSPLARMKKASQAWPDAEVEVRFCLHHTANAEASVAGDYVCALLDDRLMSGETVVDEHFGSRVLARAVASRDPSATIIVASQHARQYDAGDVLCQSEGLVVCYLEKSALDTSLPTRLCVAGLIIAAVARQQATEAERRMGEENAKLRRGLRIRDEVAHGSYGLLEHVRHLVGLDEAILCIARTIEPFYQHKNGVYQSVPKGLQRKFPAALMLEGEPGSGKTTLCMAIANSLGIVHHLSPALISPGQHVGQWQKPLRDSLTEAFLRARDCETVVIKADDIAWPDVAGIRDHGLRAEWQDLMSFLRLCIRLASALNNHAVPSETPLDIKNMAAFRGKVLWLFARNEDEMIGEMFAPLKDVLLTVPIVFPKDEASRRRILELYVDKEGVAFAEDAMALALKETSDYSGRALIGDDDMGRGFVFWAIAGVKDRELARWQADNSCRLDLTITRDIVEKWLAGPLHKEVAKLAGGSKTSLEPYLPTERKRGTFAGDDTTPDVAWRNGIDMDQALALARDIWVSQGGRIDNDPDTILTEQGAPCLRAVLALMRGGFRRRFGRRGWTSDFDRLFGFGAGRRASMGLSQYLQNISRKHSKHFTPRNGRAQFGVSDVEDDAAALEKEGFKLDLE